MPTSVPSPTRKVLVCFAPDTIPDWFNTSEVVDDRLQAQGTPVMRFQARHTSWWQWILRGRIKQHLLNIRAYAGGKWCSGGPKGLLDIKATIAVAADDARARYRTWKRDIERVTKEARPWSEYLAQHENDPKAVGWQEARRRFENQPRVIAMLGYSGTYEFDPYELELYQACEEVYVTYCWRTALAGDTLITADGKVVKPASTSMADRQRYLRQGCQYVYDLSAQHSICMVVLA